MSCSQHRLETEILKEKLHHEPKVPQDTYMLKFSCL